MANTVTDSLNYDGLVAGQFRTVTDVETLLSGENVSRGGVLGKVTASGKLKLLDKNATDGSENPFAVAAQAVDATGGDENISCYLSGEFASDKLSFVSGTVYGDVKDAMRTLCMYVKVPGVLVD